MNPQEPEPLRIRQIRIDGLFGLYNHCINLNLKERVTILHGPNGVGKTITLRMVDALLKGDYDVFFRYPFDKFIALFDNGTELSLSRANQKGFSNIINLNLVTDNQTSSPPSGCLYLIENVDTPFPLMVGEEASSGQMVDKMASHPEGSDRLHINKYFSIPIWLNNFRQQSGFTNTSAYLITIERLIVDAVPTVMSFSSNIKSSIEKALAQYSQNAQTLDQSFPLRLLSILDSASNHTELKERMIKLDTNRQALQEIGLLDKTPEAMFVDPKKLDDLIAQEEKFMMLYVQDTEKKLGQLEYLARRCKLLLDNINSKFKNKRLRIDREKGFVVTNDLEENLDLDSLSSGEQHEIVLLYDLLFRIKPNTMVLIDEPELSLHVSWQDHFLPDLLKIVEIAQFDVLIATHSPYIVGDYIELMVALETGTERA